MSGMKKAIQEVIEDYVTGHITKDDEIVSYVFDVSPEQLTDAIMGVSATDEVRKAFSSKDSDSYFSSDSSIRASGVSTEKAIKVGYGDSYNQDKEFILHKLSRIAGYMEFASKGPWVMLGGIEGDSILAPEDSYLIAPVCVVRSPVANGNFIVKARKDLPMLHSILEDVIDELSIWGSDSSSATGEYAHKLIRRIKQAFVEEE